MFTRGPDPPLVARKSIPQTKQPEPFQPMWFRTMFRGNLIRLKIKSNCPEIAPPLVASSVSAQRHVSEIFLNKSYPQCNSLSIII
ncbi:hypothetical protein ETAA8_49630 [Anatilimnocola aggregata]|uniref:Uncharacterized protein n=1 Tax=Anatilimnocola aggregata TaxID=2528021 RepID=A0A517YHY2_9BACT|nr:hypothetical protein ETAA8_49630 [Anatilimnocola aggregata]